MKKFLIIIALCLTSQLTWAELRKVGDMNADGDITVADITALQKLLSGQSVKYSRVADVNNDQKIDRTDVEKLAEILLEKSPVEYYDHIDGGSIEEDPLNPNEGWD